MGAPTPLIEISPLYITYFDTTEKVLLTACPSNVDFRAISWVHILASQRYMSKKDNHMFLCLPKNNCDAITKVVRP